MEQQETLYITGESRTNMDNAITKVYGSFYIAMEVDGASGEILDFCCSCTLRLTEEFLRRLFVGRALDRDCAAIEADVLRRYYGSSARAVIVALRDANKRYAAAREKLNQL